MKRKRFGIIFALLLAFVLAYYVPNPVIASSNPDAVIEPMDLVYEFHPVSETRFAKYAEDLPDSLYVTVYHLDHLYGGYIHRYKTMRNAYGYVGYYSGMVPLIR